MTFKLDSKDSDAATICKRVGKTSQNFWGVIFLKPPYNLVVPLDTFNEIQFLSALSFFPKRTAYLQIGHIHTTPSFTDYVYSFSIKYYPRTRNTIV